VRTETDLSRKNAVSLRGITKRYGETLALDSVDLDIGANQIVALLGPNGAGKTTLLHILCTILQPDKGTAEISGFDILKQPLKARKHLGVVFQEPSLDDRLSVYENLDFHGLVYQVPWRLRRQRIDEVLDLVELGEWRDEMVRALSAGMKRRLEIARALIHESRVILLDEPTVGLDVQSRARIWEYLENLRRTRELTVIVTTHYIEEVEGCDQVCIIDKGTILAQGSPEVLKQTHGRQVLRATPRDETAENDILRLYPGALRNSSGQLLLQSASSEMIDDFLRQFGTRVRQIDIDTASLESVFLSLTGRELRDKPADAREKTLASGRRGGEFTR
jgi:ABC-type multidrug transport system, ATPase component